MRLNIWAYNTTDQTLSQITRFDDFDISYMAGGPQDIVFEAGGGSLLDGLHHTTICPSNCGHS